MGISGLLTIRQGASPAMVKPNEPPINLAPSEWEVAAISADGDVLVGQQHRLPAYEWLRRGGSREPAIGFQRHCKN